MYDFSIETAGEFATLDTGIPPSPASVHWPVLSSDGLAFYYHVAGAADTTKNGEYEALRTSTAMPFPVGTLMPAAVQPFDGITGMSSDRMTAFVTMGFGTQIMTRTSLSQPFALVHRRDATRRRVPRDADRGMHGDRHLRARWLLERSGLHVDEQLRPLAVRSLVREQDAAALPPIHTWVASSANPL